MGDRARAKRIDGTLAERFWPKVNKNGPVPTFAPHLGPCWLFLAALNPAGYGTLSHKLAHRIAYELLVGPIPEGLELDHLCRVHDCCNPAHLEPVTRKVNAQRSMWVMKTHCPRGHPYDEANTYRAARGDRMCRECARINARRRQPQQVYDPAKRRAAYLRKLERERERSG